MNYGNMVFGAYANTFFNLMLTTHLSGRSHLFNYNHFSCHVYDSSSYLSCVFHVL